jgi:hypothetical protein
VIVETTGNQVKAYLSWYWGGMLVLDVTDPYNREPARYFDNSPEFLESNGGLYVLKRRAPGRARRRR